jgi:hypothetical protein
MNTSINSRTVIDPTRLSTYVNPSQIISQHPPSSSSSSNTISPPTKKSKRKRTDTPPDESCDSSSQPKKPTKDRPKKKKANRACFHCQKAHLTCDDCQSLSLSLYDSTNYQLNLARPCQRCIRRGISTNCTEGHRKKAKYLLDDDELGSSICPYSLPFPHYI